MKASELREMTEQELRDELTGCKRELFNLRFQWQTEESSNPAQYKRLRHDIARICTVLRERDLGINAELDALKSPEEPAQVPSETE